jgi:hypothetical protein
VGKGHEGEMTQTMYAHVNKWLKKKKRLILISRVLTLADQRESWVFGNSLNNKYRQLPFNKSHIVGTQDWSSKSMMIN